MKKITSIAIATIIILCTFTVILTSCTATPETETTTVAETTTVTEVSTETVSETTTSLTADLDFLHDYNQDASYDEGSWKLDDNTYFIDGNFYSTSTNEVVFSLNSIEDIDDPLYTRLLGYSSSSDGTNYITCKCLNNIWVIMEKDHQFEYKLIAEDAVWDYDMLHFDRGDRFAYFCNNDAVQFGRSVIYRCKNGGLVQIDIWNDGIITTNNFESENPVLITDYSGVYWLQVEDFEEYKLTDLIRMSQYPENHPEHYINKDGVLEMFTIYS